MWAMQSVLGIQPPQVRGHLNLQVGRLSEALPAVWCCNELLPGHCIHEMSMKRLTHIAIYSCFVQWLCLSVQGMYMLHMMLSLGLMVQGSWTFVPLYPVTPALSGCTINSAGASGATLNFASGSRSSTARSQLVSVRTNGNVAYSVGHHRRRLHCLRYSRSLSAQVHQP